MNVSSIYILFLTSSIFLSSGYPFPEHMDPILKKCAILPLSYRKSLRIYRNSFKSDSRLVVSDCCLTVQCYYNGLIQTLFQR